MTGRAREEEDAAPLHPMLDALFETFEQAGVRWCVLRGEVGFAATDGDVDLLVDPADMALARFALSARQFALISSWGRGLHAYFVGYHPPTEAWIKVDIVTELAYGSYLDLWTGAAQGCLARRRRNGRLWVLAPDDAFWALLLHCMLNKGAFTPDQAARLQELASVASTDSPLAQRVRAICPPGWDPGRTLQSVACNEWSSLVRLAPVLKARWRRSDSIRTRGRAVINGILWWPEKIWARLRRRGVSVVLLGPDGAGKSTLAAGVRQSFYLPVQSVYMGVWPRTRALELPSSPPRPPAAMFALRAVATAAHLRNIWWRYFTTQIHLTLGRTVIFDRYVYDRGLFPRQSVGWVKWLYLRFVPPAIPAPDLVLLLDVAADVMYARKGEQSPEYLESQRQELLALGRRLAQLQVVDGMRDEAAIRADVMGRIWTLCCNRWSPHPRYNGREGRMGRREMAPVAGAPPQPSADAIP